MRPTNFLTSFALFTAVTSAWPAALDRLDPLGTKAAARIRARQDNNDESGDTSSGFDLSMTIEQGNTATTRSTQDSDDSTASASRSGSNNSDNEDASSTGSRNNSDDEEATSTGSGRSRSTASGDDDDDKKSTRTFDNRLPAGGVQMVTPNPIAGPKYYKIKDHVTFGFNFTSLSITPSAIDILATCTTNSETYTIAQNHSVTGGGDGGVQAVTWDTGEYQRTASVPLLMGTYTLMIHDAAKDIDATPSAGYLGTWEQFTFGMYVPQPYTPLADYVCATCSGAFSSTERLTMGFLLGMATVTVVSFSWFAGVAGLW